MGGKGLFHLPGLRSLKSQGRSVEAGTEVEAQRNTAYWLASHDLLMVISYRIRTTCLEEATSPPHPLGWIFHISH